MSKRLFLSFLGLLLASHSACASRPHTGGGQFEFQVEDEAGNPLQTFHRHGHTYVLGEYNHRYNVRVFNRTHRRIEAVVTVDGRDVISGQVGDYSKQRGYVIDAYDSVLIEGFRRSMNTVAAFRFTNPGDSYSSRRGTPQHVGVIGVAVFKERARRNYIRKQKPLAKPKRSQRSFDYGTSSSAADSHVSPQSLEAPAPERSGSLSHKSRSASSSARSSRHNSNVNRPSNLGTRFGENHHSQAVSSPFVRANHNRPQRILTTYYDNYAGLIARGVISQDRFATPSPFPRQGFAPAP
ncbi:MAG: hypothetical protein ACON3Z_03475 [Bradymonadia bacterium]